MFFCEPDELKEADYALSRRRRRRSRIAAIGLRELTHRAHAYADRIIEMVDLVNQLDGQPDTRAKMPLASRALTS